MRILLIRPIDESLIIAHSLRKQNIDVSIDALIQIEQTSTGSINPDKYQALIFTSPNGVRAFNDVCGNSNILTFTVGNKTLKVAETLGFRNIISADGNVKKLSNTIIGTIFPKNGPLLYTCGKHISGNLKPDLENVGFSVDKNEVYDAVATKNLSEQTISHIKNANIDYIPFYSQRSALIFITLIKKAGLEKALSNITALCLSSAIKEPLIAQHWKNIMTATHPTQYNLFKLIDIEL